MRAALLLLVALLFLAFSLWMVRRNRPMRMPEDWHQRVLLEILERIR